MVVACIRGAAGPGSVPSADVGCGALTPLLSSLCRLENGDGSVSPQPKVGVALGWGWGGYQGEGGGELGHPYPLGTPRQEGRPVGWHPPRFLPP